MIPKHWTLVLNTLDAVGSSTSEELMLVVTTGLQIATLISNDYLIVEMLEKYDAGDDNS